MVNKNNRDKLNDPKTKRFILEKVCSIVNDRIFDIKETRIHPPGILDDPPKKMFEINESKVILLANSCDNYVVFARRFGTRSILVITKQEENYYVVSFPKHKIELDYKNLEKLHLFPIEGGAFHDNLYDDTIAIGTYSEYLSNTANQTERKRSFIIEDVCCIAGKSLNKINNRCKRLDDIRTILNDPTSVVQSESFDISVVDTYNIDPQLIDVRKMLVLDKICRNIEYVVFVPKVISDIKRVRRAAVNGANASNTRSWINWSFSKVIEEGDRIDSQISSTDMQTVSEEIVLDKFVMIPSKKGPDCYNLSKYVPGQAISQSKSGKANASVIANVNSIESKHLYKSWFQAEEADDSDANSLWERRTIVANEDDDEDSSSNSAKKSKSKKKKNHRIVFCKKESDGSWTPVKLVNQD